MSCPWESYIMVFAVYCHTRMWECAWAVRIQRSLWLQRVHMLPLTCVHALGYCVCLRLQRCTHWSPLWHVARTCFWLSPEWGWLPLSSCWTFPFQIALWWKGRLLITRKHSNRRPISLPLCEAASPQKSRVPSPHSHSPANRNWKIWAILGLPFFPYLCQCPSCRFPLFPLL